MGAGFDREKRQKPRGGAEPEVSPAEPCSCPKEQPAAGAGLPLFLRLPGSPGAARVRAKLTVSQAGDPDEQHADLVAERVMRDEPAAGACSGCAGGAPCAKCAGEAAEHVHRKEGGAHGPDTKAVAPRPSQRLEGLAGGRPLDAAARDFFEPRFGRDLSGVRIHTGGPASASAKGFNALAYTVGRDIVFGQGQYDAGSQAGRRLLAHELAHVLQQDFGSGPGAAVPGPLIQRQPTEGQGGARGDGGGRGTGGTDGAGGGGGAGGFEGPVESAQPPDPNAPIQPPPEHAGRVEELAEMRQQIDEVYERRSLQQEQYRALPPVTDDETEAQRQALKSGLTNIEEQLVGMLERRIAFIGETIRGLEEVLPGSSPPPPPPGMSSPENPPRSENTVRSEIYRLDQERRENQEQLLLLKTCLARKRLKEIKAELAKTNMPEVRGLELEDEKHKLEAFLNAACVKTPATTKHPARVSQAVVEKIKKLECFVEFPYVALEGETAKKGGDEKGDEKEEKKKSGAGCTIGYGHVIQPKEAVCTHGTGAPVHRCGRLLSKCDCTPALEYTPEQAEERLLDDRKDAAAWIKEHVLVDLDQEHFDALVDMTLSVGSIPKGLLDAINSKLCTDDEAVRQQYMKTALGVRGRPDLSPTTFEGRRRERVWSPQGEDPTCI